MALYVVVRESLARWRCMWLCVFVCVAMFVVVRELLARWRCGMEFVYRCGEDSQLILGMASNRYN